MQEMGEPGVVGLVALRGRCAGGGRKPPRAAAVKSRGGERRGKRRAVSAAGVSQYPIIQGWIHYYGRFYRSVLVKVLRRINAYLVRWAMSKYKRLRRYPAKARKVPGRRLPTPARPVRPLALWCAPRRLDDGSPVSGDVHAGCARDMTSSSGVRVPCGG